MCDDIVGSMCATGHSQGVCNRSLQQLSAILDVQWKYTDFLDDGNLYIDNRAFVKGTQQKIFVTSL